MDEIAITAGIIVPLQNPDVPQGLSDGFMYDACRSVHRRVRKIRSVFCTAYGFLAPAVSLYGTVTLMC